MTRIAFKHCEHCGTAFERQKGRSQRQWEATRFCGRECSGAAAVIDNREKRGSLQDRFATLFSRSAGCWEWQGTIDGYGYGVIDHAGRRYRAHVLCLEFDDRPVPTDRMALHHCDNRRCVRPSHLYIGTALDNARDAQGRGRNSRGEHRPQSKLTEADVRQIRASSLPYAVQARRLGVSRPTIARIARGEGWRHVQ